MDNTQDLSKFGYRELYMAGDLLKAYKTNKDKTHVFGRYDSGVNVEFNPNSGNVFLVDSDYNVAMMNGHDLEDFFSCPICGHEGFLEDMKHGEDNPECLDYVLEIQKGE